MQLERMPTWTRYAAFALVIIAISGFAVATADRNKSPTKAKPTTGNRIPSAASPEGVAVRALLYLQAGSGPSTITLYHPRILSRFGAKTVTTSLQLQKPSLRGQSFSVKLSDEVPRGRLVLVYGNGPQGTGNYSFTLHRVGGSWKIVYDNLLGQGLPQYILARAQRGQAKGTPPSRKAERAANRAAADYESLLIAKPSS